MTAPLPELAGRAMRGLVWGAGSHVGRQLVQLAVFLILARVLAPADFGLIAMVLAVTGLMSIVSDLGIAATLVQAPRVAEAHRDTMFCVAAVLGLVVAALVFAVSQWVAAFYAEPRVEPLVKLVSLTFIFNNLGSVHGALLQRQMRFRRLSTVEFAGAAAGGATALLLAGAGYGIWSLAWQPVAASAVTACALWIGSEWRPKFRFSGPAARELVGFSWRLGAYNTANYFVRNADDLLVGRYLGATALGLYGRAYGLLMLPVVSISGVAGRVMLPALSHLREDHPNARRAYLRALEGVALVAFPVTLGLLAVADDFVPAVLGSSWTGMIPVLRIFAALGAVQAVASTTGWIFQSQGRADQLLRWGLFAAPVLISSYVIGILIGTIEAVAGAYAVASGIVLLYPAFAYPGRLIGLRASEIASRLWPVLACAASMAVIVALIGILLPPDWPAALRLVVRVVAGVVVYLGLVHATRLNALSGARHALSLIRGPLPASGMLNREEPLQYERI